MSIMSAIRSGVVQGFRDLASRAESRVEVSNPSKVVGNDLVNGDVNILHLSIYKSQAVFDLKSQVTEIHIYESIVSPVMFCTMTFADAINLRDDFKIKEDDIVKFVFQTPGTSQSNEYFLQVNRIFNKRDVPGLTMKVYDVELISVEGTVAENVPMGDFRLEDNSGTLIERIVTDYITPPVQGLVGGEYGRRPQRLAIDRGNGIISKNEKQVKVLRDQNRRPFEVIHQLALLTNRSPEGHSLYTFFERKDGYYFKPIEWLMSDGKKKLRDDQSDAIFFYDHLRNQNQSAVKFRNILAYNVSSSGNLAEGRAAGVNTIAVTTNPQTGENTIPARVGGFTGIAELTSAEALRAFDVVTRSENITSTEFTHLNEVLVSRRELLFRISQYEAQIMVYGDSNISVGDVIECQFPRSISTSRESSDPHGGSELSDDSGYYLITHLRHMILNTDRPQHVISCNLMRAEPERS
jgi:hypothetical protein